uniref:[Histone H3]-lysine(4) N-trimethyltransferase n=1 Tax=Angiostrongylus cantonensis TaxID=6313 RepID=A0A0K0DMI2_ANGCA
LGRIPTETRSSAEVRRSGSPKAGTVWDVQSIVGKQGKKIGREVDQWRRSHAFLASWNHSPSISGYEGALHNHNSRNSASITQPKAKSKRKDVLYPDDDNEIIVITGKKREKHVKNVAKPQKHSRKNVLFDHVSTVAARKSRQRIPKLVSRLTVVNRTPVPEEQGFAHRKRVKPQDHDDDNTAIDIETVDDTVEEAIKELIASAPPSGFPDTKEQCLQTPGRPPKKFRGRLAKQKQAIRDAEIAEKVAIKQRELPVLDLTLKVIEDPTVELPLEATILLDSSIIHDTALLHEVGEVLKELVAQVCLEELQPKRDIKSRSRRCWEHLPERVRSKRQEYRNLNVPVAQRSPPPPPLRSKPRGRNSEKYRQAVLERAKQQSGEGAAPNIRNVRPSPIWESKPLNTSQEVVAEIKIGGGENVAHCSNHDQSPSLCSKSQSGMRNAWEEDFAFSGLEDFDLNEDDLVDINVDTFFKSAENIDTSSGDEGDAPSHKMRQKLRTFLGEVVHFPRVTPTRVDSNDPKKASTEASSSTEASKSLGTKQEHIQEDQTEDDVGRVATHVIDIIIDQISSWICHSLEYNDKLTEQKTCGDQFTHFREPNSLVSVVLSLKKSESSGTALQKIMDTDITSSFHDDYGNCYRHIRLSTSVIPELKTSSLHNVGVDVLDFPFDMSAVADLSVKDVDVRLDNISSEYPVPNAYLTSDEVAHIQTAENHSSKEDLVFPDIEYSSCCDIVFFEAVGEEERYSVSGAVNIAAVGVECLNIVRDVSINLSHTEFTCSHVEERCFDVQKNFAGFTYSNQQCVHSIHTMDTNFSGNDEHLQVCFSLLCANAEVDQLSIIVSDLSLIHLTPDATGNIMFESLVGTGEEFEGISVSTTGTIIVPFEEYCSFSNISTSNVIKDGRLTESILISHNVPCAEQERNALSVIGIDCSFVNIDEEEEMAELAFLTKSHLLQICGTITPVKLKVTNDGFFAIIEGIHANSDDLQTEQPVIGTGNEVMAESFSCSIPLATTISGELEESCIRSFCGREDTREGPYLLSDDPPDSGFSPITYLEQCFIQSPDLFGIKADMSRKKRRIEHSASTSDQVTGPITRSRAKRLSAEREKSIVKFTANDTSIALDHLWRRTHYTAGESLIGTVAIICKAFKLATIKSSNPIVTLEPDMSKLATSIRPLTPFRLSLPRCEGSLESALMQYEAGVKCILEQVKSTRSVVENIRSSSHWTLHFLMDAQLYMLDIQYEIWEYLTRCVQLGVFSIYQCSLWETHHQLFDARMHCLLFEMNTAVALASKAEMCSSYVRRFEEWNRKTNNFSSIYNNAHGLALSLIKHITIPNALTRLQSMTHWNSKERPYKNSEEMEKFFLDTQSIECDSLENLISDNVTRNNSANGFSFLFPSFAVLSICRNQIYKEVSSYFNNHIDELMRNDHYHLSLISPLSRAYVLSRFHETRAKFLMRNNIMNLNKIIAKLNSTFDELKGIVDKTGQVELDCPCGQVVFFFDSGKVGVNINSLSTENVHVPDPVLAEEGRRIMGDCVKNTVFDPLTIVEQEKGNSLTMKHDRMKKSIEIVKDWVMTVSSTYDDEVHCETTDAGVECVEPVEVMCPSSPAHVTVIEDVDDESGSLASVVSKQTKKKCCNIDTVTTTIAGRRIEYSVNCADGVLKMKTMDSLTDDTSTDNLSATNTITTASFNSFDQIETLKIIRSHETGEFNWIAMIKSALDGIPAPKITPDFLRGSGSSDCQIDVYAELHLIDFNNSETSLEFTMPKADERDKVPLYALWISEVVRYADIERKRMMQLRPINNVGRCRAARSEMIREFAIPCKRARRCNSTPPWFGRTVYEHYGDDLSLGMARLEYEISGRKMQPDPQIGSHDDAITHYFISRNNSPSTMVDPLELLENPYSFFQHKPVAGKRILPPLVESSLVKKVCLSDPPIFAPFTSLKNEPETLYPPYDSDFDSSDDEL